MKSLQILNKSLGMITVVNLPLNVQDYVVSPSVNTATIDDVILEATQARPSNISTAYNVQVIEAIGVDTTGLNFNTSSYAELYALITEINNRSKA